MFRDNTTTVGGFRVNFKKKKLKKIPNLPINLSENIRKITVVIFDIIVSLLEKIILTWMESKVYEDKHEEIGL